MPQHREVSPKDLGLSAEDQEMMRLGDVFPDPDKKKAERVKPASDDNALLESDVHPSNFPKKKPRLGPETEKRLKSD